MNLKAHRSNLKQFFITTLGICALACTTAGVAQGDTVKDLDKKVDELRKEVKSMVSVPVGTIMVYGGDLSNEKVKSDLKDQGWLPCDGAEISSAGYRELYDAIATAFGGDKDKGTFNVPDLRGRFLRGVDQGKKRDPDAATRIADPDHGGGNTGDKVGSVQEDQFASHKHTFAATHGRNISGSSLGDPPAMASFIYNDWSNKDVAGTGGAETRPKNIYVHWIIKAKQYRDAGHL